MTDMPERINLQMEEGAGEFAVLCFCDEGEGTEYIKIDKYKELETENKKLRVEYSELLYARGE